MNELRSINRFVHWEIIVKKSSFRFIVSVIINARNYRLIFFFLFFRCCFERLTRMHEVLVIFVREGFREFRSIEVLVVIVQADAFFDVSEELQVVPE